MDDAVRRLVRVRAGRRCEYCHLPEKLAVFAAFHIEHITAKQHGGTDARSNLALSCHHCNLHKGPNLTGIDPLTRRIARLFHPRRHRWPHHFAWNGPRLVGRTAIGRVTIAVHQMNDPDAVKGREALIVEGVFPFS
jgi:hypothetical protein